MSLLVLNAVATPGAPAAGKCNIYFDTSDNRLKVQLSDGTLLPVEEGEKGYEFFRQVGTSPLERWHALGMIGAAVTTRALSKDILQAVPFYSGRGGTIDRLAVHVTVAGTVTSGTGKARLGIYKNTSGTALYPGSLLIDAGEVVVTSTGVKSVTVAQSLPRCALLWAVVNHDCDLSNPTLEAIDAGSGNAVLGVSASDFSAVATHIEKSSTYAALVSTFPASGTAEVSAAPLIGARYSA